MKRGMMSTVKPATDEQIIIRIRADAERIRVLMAEHEALRARDRESEAFLAHQQQCFDLAIEQQRDAAEACLRAYSRRQARNARLAKKWTEDADLLDNDGEAHAAKMLRECALELSAPNAQAAAETITDTEHPLKRAARISQEPK